MNAKALQITGYSFVAIAIGLAIAFVCISAFRSLTSLENSLFQFLSLGIGLTGSFLIGNNRPAEQSVESIKPYARSAFRRVLSLYTSLSRLALHIEKSKAESKNVRDHVFSMDKLGALVEEQIATADHAIDDWKEIIPEDVDAFKASLRSQA